MLNVYWTSWKRRLDFLVYVVFDIKLMTDGVEQVASTYTGIIFLNLFPIYVNTRSKIQQLILKLSKKWDLFPTSFLLRDVKCLEEEPRGVGGFANIYCGEYKGEKVALKCLRVYSTMEESERMRLKRVGHVVILEVKCYDYEVQNLISHAGILS